MAWIAVEDVTDIRLAKYRDLKPSNETRGDGRFVVEGEKLVMRLWESRFPLVSVVIGERYRERLSGEIAERVPVYVLPDRAVSELVGFNFHQGMLACGERLAWPCLEELVSGCGPELVLVCPTVNNPENLGSILRLADVFGVKAVVVGPQCPDPFARRVLRVSMGMGLSVPVIVADDLAGVLDALGGRYGFHRIATVLDPNAVMLPKLRRPVRAALLLGQEAHGLDPAWLSYCDTRVMIPMRAGAESLNVAVAAGIVLYHLTCDDRSGSGDLGSS